MIKNLAKKTKTGKLIKAPKSSNYKILFIGQRYFDEKVKFKHNPSFLTKTVNKIFPIKTFNNYYIFDTLYSDHVLFDI